MAPSKRLPPITRLMSPPSKMLSSTARPSASPVSRPPSPSHSNNWCTPAAFLFCVSSSYSPPVPLAFSVSNAPSLPASPRTSPFFRSTAPGPSAPPNPPANPATLPSTPAPSKAARWRPSSPEKWCIGGKPRPASTGAASWFRRARSPETKWHLPRLASKGNPALYAAPLARPSLLLSFADEDSCVRAGGRPHARAGDRRQYRDFQPREHRFLSPGPVPGAGAHTALARFLPRARRPSPHLRYAQPERGDSA